MQPVDALSGSRSLPLARVTVSSTEVTQTDAIVEKIPIVEPMPHYPLSATVSEIMAHITELIKEQQAASQEAMHQKNLEDARAEMERIFEAAVGKSDDNNLGVNETDAVDVFAVDARDGVDNKGLQISENSDKKSTLFGQSSNIETDQEFTAQKTEDKGTIDKSASDVRSKSANDGKLPPLPSDVKLADKKGDNPVGVKTHKMDAPGQIGNVQHSDAVDVVEKTVDIKVNK